MIFNEGDRVKINSDFNENSKKELVNDLYGTIDKRIDPDKLPSDQYTQLTLKVIDVRRNISRFITENDFYQVILDEDYEVKYDYHNEDVETTSINYKKVLVPSCLLLKE
jgi:hypothetical protein